MYYISCYCNEYHTTTKTTLCIVSCVVCTEKCLIVAQIISKQTFTKNLVKIYRNYFEPWSLTLSLLKHPRCWQSILQEEKNKRFFNLKLLKCFRGTNVLGPKTFDPTKCTFSRYQIFEKNPK